MKPSLVYMYYMQSGYWTSIFGKDRAYYIRIFTGLRQRANHRCYSVLAAIVDQCKKCLITYNRVPTLLLRKTSKTFSGPQNFFPGRSILHVSY